MADVSVCLLGAIPSTPFITDASAGLLGSSPIFPFKKFEHQFFISQSG
jgi:hypothetical protein